MPTPQYDEFEPGRNLWTRVRERVFGVDEAESYEEEAEPVAARRRTAIRLESAREHRVAVRMHAASFNDARQAADGLKSGEQQIVNLESAQPPMAERIIDFLSGVTYAMDGTVDRIGERVYLFAPANVMVEVDSGPEASDLPWDRAAGHGAGDF